MFPREFELVLDEKEENQAGVEAVKCTCKSLIAVSSVIYIKVCL